MSYSESALSTHGCLYTFGFLYAVTNVLVFLQGAYHEAGRHEDFQRYVTAMARGAGGLINLNSAIVLLLASRSALGLLRATPLHLVLPIDKAMPEMHRLVGSIILLASVVHVVNHIPVYAKKDVWSPGLSGFTSLFITGLLLSGSILIIYFVARPSVLHESYELFHRTHITSAVVYYGLLIVHGNHQGSPSTWKFIIGPVLIYVCDVMFRSLREKKSYLLLLKHSAACQGPHIVKIRLPRVFHYQAGQYAEIKVPILSRFQWHPFTIASAPHEPEIIFYIKAVGDWTRSLYKLFEDRTVLNDDFRDDIEIHIRGPYGAPAQHVGQFDRVILIGGGVGATPFCSVVKDAYYWIKNWIPRQHQRRTGVRNNNNTRPADNNDNDCNDMEGQRDEGYIRQDNPEAHAINLEHYAEEAVTQPPRPEQGSTESSSTQGNESHGSRTWGLLTTNVISEAITSEHSIPPDDIEETTAIQFPDREVAGMQARHPRSEHVIGDGSSNSNADDTELSTMHTARGMTEVFGSRHLLRPSNRAGTFNNGQLEERREDTEQQIANIEAGDAMDAITAIETDHSIQNVSTMAMRDRHQPGRRRRGIRRASFDEDDIHAMDRNWMGSYYGNSSSSHRHSLDYVTALQSVAYSERADAVFQKSLDMMIGMSFGSVSLMRTMQYKRTQQNIRQGRSSTTEMGVEMFHSPRVMFLLYMRSVTMNMLIVWLLIIRFTIAGAAYAFDELQLFTHGVQLYNIPALNAIDLAICLMLILLFSLPTLVEALEIGAALLHGLELFVLTPIAVFDAVIDVLALRGLARNVDKVFSLFHVFLIWPMLTILVVIRLLRVIGERITQVQTMQASHTTTRAVDFFWTAPTGDDDLWLVGELAKYSDMKELRLHRYLTREQPPAPAPQTQHALPQSPLDRNQGQLRGINRGISRGREREADRREVQQEEYMHRDGMGSLVTNHGRPNWSEIFNSVAERSLNNTTIGVFFCGPMSMSRAVQETSMEAMRNSIVRGLQGGVQAMRGLEEIFGDAITANQYTGDVDKSSTASKARIGHSGRGCNITIVFKRESFS